MVVQTGAKKRLATREMVPVARRVNDSQEELKNSDLQLLVLAISCDSDSGGRPLPGKFTTAGVTGVLVL